MEAGGERRILAQFKTETGDLVGNPFELPVDLGVEKLRLVCNAILQQDESTPYAFFAKDKEIVENIEKTLGREDLETTEHLLEIIYQPLAIFKVRAVTRCTSSLQGHTEAVISAQFSPDGRHLASGSGDTTVRFWDINTETPLFTGKVHRHWVLCISWSPDGNRLASACKSGLICLWDPVTGLQVGRSLTGHKQWVTCLSWQPQHLNADCRFLASSSKDCTIRIWDTVLCQCVRVLSSHTQCITCIKWGGSDLIYSSSQDRTIKVWRASDGVMCRSLEGHGHWVNSLALSTDYVIRTGAFDPSKASIVHKDVTESAAVRAELARQRYLAALAGQQEKLVSASDDFTMFLWQPEVDKKPLTRMTGHQQPINHVVFSPDTRIIASASFDKSIKLWDGRTGNYITSLRGHVQRVYQVSWSADSRLLCSASADSTLKVWDMRKKSLLMDLPGHADEIYAVDWSPDGQRVVSGGKDAILKIWRQ